MKLVFKGSNGNEITQTLSDCEALTILQEQYGRVTGAQFLFGLLLHKTGCATITADACAIGDGAIYAEPAA